VNLFQDRYAVPFHGINTFRIITRKASKDADLFEIIGYIRGLSEFCDGFKIKLFRTPEIACFMLSFRMFCNISSLIRENISPQV